MVSRSSSTAATDKGLSVAEIGERLAARFLVEGSVRQVGAVLRVSIRLTEVSRETHVWAERFDVCSDCIVTSLDEVASTVAASIIPLAVRTGVVASQRPPGQCSRM